VKAPTDPPARRTRSGSEYVVCQLYVSWSAGAFFVLVTKLTTVFTSTIPAACAGDTAVHVVLEVQLTEVPDVVPNLNFVVFVPRANPSPVIVTLVPPVVGPAFGLTLVTAGLKL